MGGLSNDGYLNRQDRLTKVGELLEKGVALRDISTQLNVSFNTIKADVGLITILSRGSLSPEMSAEKRLEIDITFTTLYDEVISVYYALVKDNKHAAALNYMKTGIDLVKFKATLWGLDQDFSKMANFNADSINFNKVDVTLTSSEFDTLRGAISRKNENLLQYD